MSDTILLHDLVARPTTFRRSTAERRHSCLTILGEFVLPAGGDVWTSSLLAAAEVLGIGEKNARQAIARIGDQGLIDADRHGRRVRWSLTDDGRRLLEEGARRIYGFGDRDRRLGRRRGSWHTVRSPSRSGPSGISSGRGWRSSGSVSCHPTLLISPHLDRERALRQVLARSRARPTRASCCTRPSAPTARTVDLVARAWDLDGLADSYARSPDAHRDHRPTEDRASFRALVELVHDWRRFPFTDPELPTELLPDCWAGPRRRRCSTIVTPTGRPLPGCGSAISTFMNGRRAARAVRWAVPRRSGTGGVDPRADCGCDRAMSIGPCRKPSGGHRESTIPEEGGEAGEQHAADDRRRTPAGEAQPFGP